MSTVDTRAELRPRRAVQPAARARRAMPPVARTQQVARLWADPLLRNAAFLLLNTALMGLFGFVFFAVCSRLFSPAQVGVAGALISAVGVVGYVAQLGMDGTVIRYLPGHPAGSDRPRRYVGTGLVLVTGCAASAALVYALAAVRIAPDVAAVLHGPATIAAFVLLATAVGLNQFTDSVFIALRSAGWNAVLDGVLQSVVKVALPVALAGLGAFGMFASTGLAAAVAAGGSALVLHRRFRVLGRPVPDREVLRQARGFASGSYLSTLLNISPTLVLPLVVLNGLGPAPAAFYYVAFMLANLVYTAGYAMGQSLFAEIGHSRLAPGRLLARGGLVLAAVLLPAALLVEVLSGPVLGVFGPGYQAAGGCLRILVLGAPAVSLYSLASMALRATGRVRRLVLLDVLYAVAITAAAVWAVRFGLTGVALAWIGGHLAAGLLGLAWARPALRRPGGRHVRLMTTTRKVAG